MPESPCLDDRRSLLGDQPVRKVLVLRALRGLGDQLCLVPALRALRQGLPHAEVTLVGVDETSWMQDRFPAYVDRFVPFPGFPGVAEKPADEGALLTFLALARDEGYDLAVQAHGSGVTTNPFVALLSARMAAGHALPGQLRPDPPRFRDWRPHEPEPLRYVRLLDHLGIPPAGDHLEIPVTEADRAAAARLLPAPADGYVCVHPGSHLPSRRWHPERFAEVADRLVEAGLPVVLTGGPSERMLVEAVRGAMRHRCTSLAGRTDLGPLAAVLERARLLVCNDTGVSHLAAALGVPSVVVFRCSDPDRWAPLDRTRHRAVGLDDPVVSRLRGTPAGHCCLGDGCQAAPVDEERLPPSSVTADDVMAEARLLAQGEVAGQDVPVTARR